jgi:hypothetical protein
MEKKNRIPWLAGLVSAGLVAAPAVSFAQCPSNETTVWQNHYVFSPGAGLTVSLPGAGIFGVSAPVGGTLTKTLDVPPGFQIRQVIACSVPAASGAVLTQFDVSIPLVPVAHGPELPPYCETFVSADPNLPLINPQAAPTTLTLDFGPNPAIQVTGLGLVLRADPTLWSFVPPHEHVYLTGRGRGHNNTTAVTEGLAINGEECTSTDGTTPLPDAGEDDGSDDGKGKDKHKNKGKGKGKGKKGGD